MITEISNIARKEFLHTYPGTKGQRIVNEFQEAYPPKLEQNPLDNFFIWYYITYMMPTPSPIIITLPAEKDGPFDALQKDWIPLVEHEPDGTTGEAEEECDFWSILASQQNDSILRIMECDTEETMDAFEKQLMEQLKSIKKLGADDPDDFLFTSIELMNAIALCIYEFRNKKIIP